MIKVEEKKMGRPTDNPRNLRLSLRMTADEMKEIDDLAKKLSMTKTNMVLKAVAILREQTEK
ncbi:hypothetical protein [Lachnoanaerobaculum saburreum]|mgnify:FL=1|uniref:Ribbon-helix-helix protein, CopG family n=1 Tax=Lachnoanaerobaculum saburreum TaxID=467210 RepID=A0A133ZSV4_9FIRM|nr:hypothetical protein [Lachnoanaerobaculum saburreum]KXB58513.1 hypothetical protein HMPREF1866_01125 [Lachnoanaerobaculum saburreum]